MDIELEIIKFYCICDDTLKEQKVQEDPQTRMSNAEIMTTAFVAVRFFKGNFEFARAFLLEYNYILRKDMLSKSQFIRRLHRIDKKIWQEISLKITQNNISQNKTKAFVIDSFPISVCDNWRIRRCKIYAHNKYRGYIASKRRYFYGVRVHCVTTADGKLVNFVLAPGSYSDIAVAKTMNFNLPQQSTIYSDKAYNDYDLEDSLKKFNNINWMPIRRHNSKIPFSKEIQSSQAKTRKIIETTFSVIRTMLPNKVHSVTSKGFELKIVLFLLAFGLRSL